MTTQQKTSKQPKHLILHVDDESFFAQNYRSELSDHFTVEFCDDAMLACDKLRDGPEYRGLVLDIMMPTPDGVAATETNGGLSTGVWVLRQCAQRIKSLPIPVVVLTNRELQDVQAEIEDLRFPKGLIVQKPKKKTPAEQLPGVVQELLNQWHKSKVAS